MVSAASAIADQDTRTTTTGRDSVNRVHVKGLAGRDVSGPVAVGKAAPGSRTRAVAVSESACIRVHRR